MFLLRHKKFQGERGAAVILLTLFILAFLTAITFIITRLMIQEIRVSQDIKNSFKAYEMTVSGMELGSYKYKTGETWNPGGETEVVDQNLKYTTVFQNGEIISKGQYIELERQLGAQQIFGGLFQQVSSYGLNSCAVSKGTYVYCWGSNSNGQLGINSSGGNSFIPILVLRGEAVADDNDGMYLKNIKSVSVGNQYACALSGQDGSTSYAYCWGLNNNGQLGNNTIVDSFVPVRVWAGEAIGADQQGGYLANIANISAGSHHTCVAASSSNVYCWGFDQIGELGDGLANNGIRALTPRRVIAGNAHLDDQTGGPVSYLDNIKTISTFGGNINGSYTCALSFSSRVYCWGNNIHSAGPDTHSLLGIGTTIILGVDMPLRVLASPGAPDFESVGPDNYLANIKEISMNGIFHACAISNDSTNNNVYCWGVNQGGALGDSTTTVRLVPVRVLAGSAVSTGDTNAGTFLGNIKNVSTGGVYTCAVSDNIGNFNGQFNVYCWGSNMNGNLGDGTTTQRLTPVRVLAGQAVLNSGDFFNDAGTDYLVNIKSISGGTATDSTTCAVSNNNKGYCWGNDSQGQLGNDNNNMPATTPVRVFGS